MDDRIRIGLAGAGAGLAATVAMSGLMIGARRAGLMHRHPPEEIVERSVERATGQHLSGTERRTAASAAHLAFGAAFGALFAGAWSAARPAAPAALVGILYGTAIWAASYLGWLPALELTPPGPADQRRRPLVMVAAHWLYGGVLGAAVDRIGVPRS
jgi:hypothetical protein